MSERILVVDDEKEIADLIELYLSNENYIVYKFYEGQSALDFAVKTNLDLAILDVMLPDIDGFYICRKIRENNNYPIIMLTAKNEEIDKITGLTLGADDYITKPFRPLELIARVKAQLRRYNKYSTNPIREEENPCILSHYGLTLNIENHECDLNGEKLSLTPTEFSILKILLENKGKVVSSEQLFFKIWGEEYYEKNNNTITVHIRHLREKMHDAVESPAFIKTIWGVGYKIET